MKIRLSEIVSLVILALSFALGVYVYPLLPESIASHWDIHGNVNGYMSKFWGAFIMPIIATVMLVLFIVLPRIDPKRENIEKFRKHLDIFIIIVLLFLAYLYALTLYWNLKGTFNMVQFLIPGFAVLFFYVGVIIDKAKMNWSVGIRTPWTLSSETVWHKTHKLGGLLMKIAAITSLIGIAWTKYAFWLTLGPIIAVVLFSVVYSYVIFRKK